MKKMNKPTLLEIYKKVKENQWSFLSLNAALTMFKFDTDEQKILEAAVNSPSPKRYLRDQLKKRGEL